ncbi:Uncharacterized protein Fot_53122 [Forsythia ovata]|uniref:Uncharacterized protein n=1 Tax=Forsythia ovata TaxID=205694 RepID=A0ABD1PLM2_9LAMI
MEESGSLSLQLPPTNNLIFLYSCNNRVLFGSPFPHRILATRSYGTEVVLCIRMDDCSLHLDPSRLTMKVEEERASFWRWWGQEAEAATPPEQPSFEVPTVRATSARAARDTGLKAVFSATSQLAVVVEKRSSPSRKPTLVQSQMVPMKGNLVLIRVVRIRASPPPPRRPLILPPSPLAPSVPAPKLVRPHRSQIINL